MNQNQYNRESRSQQNQEQNQYQSSYLNNGSYNQNDNNMVNEIYINKQIPHKKFYDQKDNDFHHIKQQIKQRIKNDHHLKKIKNTFQEDQNLYNSIQNSQNALNCLNQEEEDYIDNKIEAIISQIDEKKWKKFNKKRHHLAKVHQQENLMKKTKSYDDSYQYNNFNKLLQYNTKQDHMQEEEQEDKNNDNNKNNNNNNNNNKFMETVNNMVNQNNQVQKRQKSPHSDSKAKKRYSKQNSAVKIEFSNPYEEQEKLYQYIINKLDAQRESKLEDESQENSSFSEDNNNNYINNINNNQSYNSQMEQSHFEITFSQLETQIQYACKFLPSKQEYQQEKEIQQQLLDIFGDQIEEITEQLEDFNDEEQILFYQAGDCSLQEYMSWMNKLGIYWFENLQQFNGFIYKAYQLLNILFDKEVYQSDIKPDNIIITIDNEFQEIEPKIIDFGVSSLDGFSKIYGYTPSFAIDPKKGLTHLNEKKDRIFWELYQFGRTIMYLMISSVEGKIKNQINQFDFLQKNFMVSEQQQNADVERQYEADGRHTKHSWLNYCQQNNKQNTALFSEIQADKKPLFGQNLHIFASNLRQAKRKVRIPQKNNQRCKNDMEKNKLKTVLPYKIAISFHFKPKRKRIHKNYIKNVNNSKVTEISQLLF
ncbi:Protein kinase-like domain [Pseudocohnilembus persalinus]|uniref:Protein kinase-like domain n=1 Tax=Pseudocohnilembus persalinus TaxID=266149 RepID=A0A0V0R8U1_PSEPJ|nr:Protein kinase-like domain [Pseudocohnilembus persalinus]|eukprot:KRX10677.1 Protein kinase-like domain [Pseudocohnilembus persalinus]